MADPIEMKFDKRIIDRNLRSGDIARADYENHLKNLKDVESNSEVVEFAPLNGESEDEASDAVEGQGEPVV